MSVGVVNASREATVRLRVLGASGQSEDIEVVIDTGFTGYLTLPATRIAALNLPYTGRQQATLADGSTLLLDVHTAYIEWDGQLRRIEVDAAETTPLIGMAMLYGYKITIEAVDGGQVIIERI